MNVTRRISPTDASTATMWRSGFSFIEVLFAVAILGIGFIMIAAIFPVSLLQTRATNEESFAAAMSRGAQRFLEQIADETTLPPTGTAADATSGKTPPVKAFQSNTNRATIVAEMVPGVDARYAWLPLYSRSAGSPYATVFLFPMQVRAQSRYDQPPDVPYDTNGIGTVDATIGAAGVQFASDEAGAAPGSYVIVSRMIVPSATGNTGADLYHGYIYQLGNRIGDESSKAWELAVSSPFVRPYYDADGDPSTPAIQVPEIGKAKVFVIGRGPSVQGNLSSTREGTGQQIAAYSTVVRLRHYTPLPPTAGNGGGGH